MKHISLTVLLAAFAFGTAGIANAQVITYDFGISSSALNLNPTTDTYADANGGTISSNGFTLVNSSTGNPARAAAVTLDQVPGSLNLAQNYISLTISKDAGSADYGLASVSFDYQVGVHAAAVQNTTFYLFSSITGFAAPGNQIASFTYTGTDSPNFVNTGTISLGASFTGLTTDTEFRIYMVDGGSASTSVSARVDNITFNAIPEPSTALLLLGGLGALIALRRCRRA